MSTINLVCSTINGVPPGGGGGGGTTNTFSTLFTSSLRVSTLVGYSYPSNSLSTVFVEGGFQFSGDFQGQAFSGRFLSSLRNINSAGEDLNIVGGGVGKEFSILYPGGLPASNAYVRIGGGSAFDTRIFDFGGAGAVSTGHLFTSSIIGNPVAGLDISGNVEITGGLFVNDTIEIPLATGGINFDDGSGINYTRMMRRDIANNNMVAFVDTTGLPPVGGCNMMPVAVGELWLTGGTDTNQACRLYSEFPFGNYELDAIDADGATLFAYIQGYYNPDGLNPGYLQAYSNVSSISGYDQENAASPMLHVINGLTTSNLIVSSINGAAPGGAASSTFTDLYTSSIAFNGATSIGSNANFNYPLFIDYDLANNVSTGGVAIAVQNHNYAGGFVVNRIEMGARASGQNYIMASWPGHNLEDLAIDATDVIFNDGNFSTIVNSDPYGLITNGAISAPQVLISSINANDARPAYTNNLTLSTMELYSGSTTLMYWDSRTTSSNINTSGYDAVVGVNGTYKMGASLQFVSAGSPNEVEFYFLKNDTPITYGGGVCEVQNNQEIVQYCEIVEPLNNGDKIQVGCYTNGGGVYVSTITGTAINSPAVILTMYKVD